MDLNSIFDGLGGRYMAFELNEAPQKFKTFSRLDL